MNTSTQALESLKSELEKLPKTTGVYLLASPKPAGGGGFDVIYIGKAINIQNRVKNHFNPAIEGKVNYTYWMIEVNKKPIGYMANTAEKGDDGLFMGRVELDILIGEKSMWEKGYGSDALRAMINYAFKKQGAQRVFLTPRLINPRAIYVYEKVGFKKEGVLRHFEKFEGKLIDTVMMSILKEEFKGARSK